MKQSIILCAIFCGPMVFAQQIQDSVRIYFRQGYSVLDPHRRGNEAALQRIADSLQTGYADSIYRLCRIEVVGGASPEGSVALNRRLSERRAKVLFGYLSRYGNLPDSLMTFTFLGRDWRGLIRLVENDPNVPFQDKTLDFLYDIADHCRDGEEPADNNVGRLFRFQGGEPYRYMYRVLFPELRASQLKLWYEKIWNPAKLPPVRFAAVEFPGIPAPVLRLPPFSVTPACKPFYMALKTNMLYDALAVPNLGVEFYLGRNWSVDADWMYAWWKTDRRHWYWRTYGGEIGIRKWFGKRAKEKPLQGHHLGLYGQLVTYDLEMGGKGIMGGKPGGSLWDKANWGVGIEYGYSLPIAYRLNIDFTLGVGYLGGEYWEYKPEDDCYVWQSTKRRRWFGPTKAEVALVWLIGRGNYNKDKGRKGGAQ